MAQKHVFISYVRDNSEMVDHLAAKLRAFGVEVWLDRDQILPGQLWRVAIRYWDLAATEKTEFNDPDWTVGVKLGRDRSGGYWVLDMVRARANPGDVEQLLLNIAEQDGKRARSGSGRTRGRPARARRSIWCGR
jgi:hypothetical protein